MKKTILGVFLALFIAIPAHAQTFTSEQQAVINQIIALIQELQRQLQIQLAIEAKQAQAQDECSVLRAEVDEISGEMEDLKTQYNSDSKAIDSNPDYLSLGVYGGAKNYLIENAHIKLNAEFEANQSRIETKWEAKIAERNSKCN